MSCQQEQPKQIGFDKLLRPRKEVCYNEDLYAFALPSLDLLKVSLKCLCKLTFRAYCSCYLIQSDKLHYKGSCGFRVLICFSQSGKGFEKETKSLFTVKFTVKLQNAGIPNL